MADFIDQRNHCWDLQKLDEGFLSVDREAILSIPLSFVDSADCLYWHFDKRGSYSVKNSYFIAMGEKARSLGSGSV